jgi:hypothetical protein
MFVCVVAESLRDGVEPGHALRNGHRQDRDRSSRDCVLQTDLKLAIDVASGETLASWRLAERPRESGPLFIVNAVRIAPGLPWDTEGASGGDYVVDQLLRNRDVPLPWNRRVRTVDLLEVVNTRRRDFRTPGRATARDRDQPTVAKRGGRDAAARRPRRVSERFKSCPVRSTPERSPAPPSAAPC